jgi:hypothetical protein
MTIKKFLLTNLIIIILASSVYAVIKIPDKTALNASTYTAVTIPASVGNECLPITAWTEDGTSWYISNTAAGTVNGLVPADAIFSDDCAQFTDGVVFYAKASAGTPDLIVLTGRND